MGSDTTSSCRHEARCHFFQMLSQSALLRITHAVQFRRCRKESESCYRCECFDNRRPVPEDLMPDGSCARLATGAVTEERVLVVDDLPAFRAAMSGLVRSACGGHVSITEAGSAEEALDVLASMGDEWTAIVTDYNMTGMTGLDLVARLRMNCEHSTLPVIVFSSESAWARAGCETDYPGVRWLTKSPDPRPFLVAWDEIVAGKGA